MGIAFYQSFMAACDDCTVDFIPMHWYDSASNFEGLKKHVGDMNDVSGGRKLWITEFGAAGYPRRQGERKERKLCTSEICRVSSRFLLLTYLSTKGSRLRS
jgi:hypothetical protein